MQFHPDTIFHIYNQGNNRQPVFFRPANYEFFLRKMRRQLLPFGHLLCYCLMPNHFHWLFYLERLKATIPLLENPLIQPEYTFNDSIGILLRSYTRAINLQENRTGCLFRPATKAKDGWPEQWVCLPKNATRQPAAWWNDYGYNCFNYIHLNPVRSGLVGRPENWPYSSCRDFLGLRNGTLCNRDLAKQLLNLA